VVPDATAGMHDDSAQILNMIPSFVWTIRTFVLLIACY